MADHRMQDVKGRVKSAVGSLTNRGDLERKGQDDRSKARIKDTAGDMKHKVQQATAKARERLSGANRRRD